MSRPDQLKPLNGFDFGKGDVCDVIFSHKKTVKACRLFIQWLKNNGNEASRKEVSQLAGDLANGRVREGFRYGRKNFYGTLLSQLKDLGFLRLQPRYDPKRKGKVSYKYVPVHQPIPKRSPLGGNTFWRKAWTLCRSFNKELFEE